MSELNDIMKLLNDGEEKESKLSMKEIASMVKKYILALWGKKWLVVAAGIIGGIIGLINTGRCTEFNRFIFSGCQHIKYSEIMPDKLHLVCKVMTKTNNSVFFGQL